MTHGGARARRKKSLLRASARERMEGESEKQRRRMKCVRVSYSRETR